MTHDEGWHTRLVRPTAFDAIRDFVQVRVDGDEPVFRFRDGRLWKSACWIKVWDDGRVLVVAEKHLTARQFRVVAGLAEEYWRGGPAQCRVERWRRIRKCKNRPVGSWCSDFWVVADRHEPGHAAAHADHALVVQSADPGHLDSTAEQYSTGRRSAGVP
ncbi:MULTISPECIES: hypothetical protein [Gordonia]|uniref:hypothetical protein n=1 Tax=Gordonia TaxID=2053 RepID=UPI0033982CBA